MAASGKLILEKLEKTPEQARVVLCVRNVCAACRSIFEGRTDMPMLKTFCVRIRFAMNQYDAESRRVPGKFDETAELLIQATSRVLSVIGSLRMVGDNAEELKEITLHVTNHRNELTKSLKASRQAQKKATKRIEIATRRLNDLVPGLT